MDSSQTDHLDRPIAEISHGPGKFEAFLDRHQRAVLVLAILLVLGAIAWIILRGIKDGAERDAGASLVAATDLAGFQATAKDHPGTLAGGSAMLRAADLQWADGQQEASVTTLKTFLEQYPKHPGRANARASLGSRLLHLGRGEEAANELNAVISDPEAQYLAPYALLALGDASWKAGQLDKAEQSYTRVTTEFAESPFAMGADRRLKLLKSAPPTAIDPLPKPAEPQLPKPTFEEMMNNGIAPVAPPMNLPQGTTPPAPPAPPAQPASPDGQQPDASKPAEQAPAQSAKPE